MALDARQLSTLMKCDKKNEADEKLIDKIKDLFEQYATQPIKNLKETLKEKLSYDLLDEKQKDLAEKVINQHSETRNKMDQNFSEIGLAGAFSKLWKNNNFLKTFTDSYTKVVDKVKGFFSIKKSLSEIKTKVNSFTKSFFDMRTLISNPKKWLGGVVKDLVSSIWVLFLSGIKIISKFIVSALKPILKAITLVTKVVLKMFAKIMFQFLMLTVRFLAFVIMQTFVIISSIVSFILFTVVPFLFTIFLFVMKIIIVSALILLKVLLILTAALLIVAVVVLIVWAVWKFVSWLMSLEWVQDLIDIAINSFQWLWDIIKWVGEAFKNFLDWIFGAGFVDTIINAFSKGMKFIFVDIPKMLFGAIEEFFGLPEGWFKDKLKVIVDWIGSTLVKTIDFLDKLFFGEDGTFYQRLKSMVLEPLKQFVSELWQDIKNIWNTFSVWLNKQTWFVNLKQSVDWLLKSFKVAWDWLNYMIIQPIYEWVQSAWDYLQGLMERVKIWWDGIWGSIKEWINTNIKEPIMNVINWIKEKIQPILDFIKNPVGGLKKTGEAIGGGIKKGLSKLKFWESSQGNIFTENSLTSIAEKGDPEAVIPLNLQGVTFFVDTLEKYNFSGRVAKSMLDSFKSISTNAIKNSIGGNISSASNVSTLTKLDSTEKINTNSFENQIMESGNYSADTKIGMVYQQNEDFKNILDSVKGEDGVNTSESSVESIVNSLTNVIKEMSSSKDIPKDYNGSAAQFRNQGNLADNDVKNDMARMIAMGFVGPKRF